MARTPRIIITGEPTAYHVMSRTALELRRSKNLTHICSQKLTHLFPILIIQEILCGRIKKMKAKSHSF